MPYALSDIGQDLFIDAQLSLSKLRSRASVPLTPKDVADAVDHAASAPGFPLDGLDAGERDRVIKNLEELFITVVADSVGGSSLDDTPIPPWLPAALSAQAWPRWYRYRTYLQRRGSMPPAAIQQLDEATSWILGRLGNPKLETLNSQPHPDSWDVRGLVVGHVQSGKTSNYTGLICKALDAGYKLVIVLTGIHESLRVQTQERLDEGVIGSRSEGSPPALKHLKVGVGEIPPPPGCPEPATNWLTNCNPNGDFTTKKAATFTFVRLSPQDPPILLVIKKNATVMRAVLNWLTASDLPTGTGPLETRLKDVPHRYVDKQCPLLVIDDEADQASIDTAKGVTEDESGEINQDHDPKIINRLIRSFMRCFHRASYVGYTATPFANILIHEEGETRTFGPDLFPRDFIYNLEANPTYVGPAAIFGLRGDPDQGTIDGLDELLVTVEDHSKNPRDDRCKEGWLPPVHTQKHTISCLSDSLKAAIADFTLAGAGLVVRGRSKNHHSMLIHCTRFQAVLDSLHGAVEAYWNEWSVRVGNGEPAVLKALRDRWVSSFVPANLAVRRKRPWEVGVEPIPWDLLVAPLASGKSPLQLAIENVHVRQIHGGKTGQTLDYRTGGQQKVIAVGGNKLSRGLTLEGLTVSYFLRTSRMYDTLMQMGRWFGYRPGYLDLCRLYMPEELRYWYEHMAVASDELRQEFDRMVAQGSKPRDFGLRVRAHPVMQVTSNVKMRHSETLRLGFSDTRPESVSFLADKESVVSNWGTLQSLLESLGTPTETNPELDRPGGRVTYQGWLWGSVEAGRVLRFFEHLRTPDTATVANADNIASYVKKLASKGELTSWSVFLRNNPKAPREEVDDEVAPGIGVGRSRRGRHPPCGFPKQRGVAGDLLSIKILIDSDYETVDVDGPGYLTALNAAQDAWRARKNPRSESPPARPGGWIRTVRPSNRGLLLLYTVQPYDPAYKAVEPALEEVRISLHDDRPLVGFAVSFPKSGLSGNEALIEYVVNNPYMNQMQVDDSTEEPLLDSN